MVKEQQRRLHAARNARRIARMQRAVRRARSNGRRLHVHNNADESGGSGACYNSISHASSTTSYCGTSYYSNYTVQVCSSTPTPTAEESVQFASAVHAVGKLVPFVILIMDILQQGLHMGLITRAEELFRGHAALLVQFNKYLPEAFQCSVPPEEVN